jgi:hypothetical protein
MARLPVCGLKRCRRSGLHLGRHVQPLGHADASRTLHKRPCPPPAHGLAFEHRPCPGQAPIPWPGRPWSMARPASGCALHLRRAWTHRSWRPGGPPRAASHTCALALRRSVTPMPRAPRTQSHTHSPVDAQERAPPARHCVPPIPQPPRAWHHPAPTHANQPATIETPGKRGAPGGGCTIGHRLLLGGPRHAPWAARSAAGPCRTARRTQAKRRVRPCVRGQRRLARVRPWWRVWPRA